MSQRAGQNWNLALVDQLRAFPEGPKSREAGGSAVVVLPSGAAVERSINSGVVQEKVQEKYAHDFRVGSCRLLVTQYPVDEI